MDATNSTFENIYYQLGEGQGDIIVCLQDNDIWLTQAQMVKLFRTSKQNISLHLCRIFQEGEFENEIVFRKILTKGADGRRYKLKHYNLEVVEVVNLRIRSHIGSHFCHWANEYLNNKFYSKNLTIR